MLSIVVQLLPVSRDFRFDRPIKVLSSVMLFVLMLLTTSSTYPYLIMAHLNYRQFYLIFV